MYLTYISDYDQNLKMSQFVLVRYQGAKISEDRKKIEPQYFEAYLQLRPEVSMSVFVQAQGIKTFHTGGWVGQKMVKLKNFLV